jgi:hypothetical protein
MAHDSAAVIAAVVLLRHGLSDDAVLRYIARRPVNERESAAALAVAHYLVDGSSLVDARASRSSAPPG